MNAYRRFWAGKEAKHRRGLREWALYQPSAERLQTLQETAAWLEELHNAAGDLAGALTAVTKALDRERARRQRP